MPGSILRGELWGAHRLLAGLFICQSNASCNGGENSLMESCACCLIAVEADAASARAYASRQSQPPSSASQIAAYSLSRHANVQLLDLGRLPPPR